jgi:chitin disaccharide deacetylase
VNLILTADDFGRSREINAGVLRAHREGILTSASLMVAGEAADEAVEISQSNPTLAVGLHVVVVDGPAVLPRRNLPLLLDKTGRFPNAPARLGIRYALSRTARSELAMEIAAQFQRFASFGLPLAHVDGHQHMHLHPAVWPIVLKLAREHGAKGIRIVRDEWRFAMRHDRSKFISKAVWKIAFRIMSRRPRRQARESGLAVADRVYGLMQSGRMSKSYVLALLERVAQRSRHANDNATAEIYFHPTAGARTDALGPNQEDLQTLLTPAVRAAIQRHGMRRCSYPDLLI